MNCKYCQNEIRPHGQVTGMHICMECNVILRHNPGDPEKKVQDEIYVRHFNDREYHLFIDHAKNQCLLYEWYRGQKVLLRIDHMITVSPQTVDNKIKTYLLFI